MDRRTSLKVIGASVLLPTVGFAAEDHPKITKKFIDQLLKYKDNENSRRFVSTNKTNCLKRRIVEAKVLIDRWNYITSNYITHPNNQAHIEAAFESNGSPIYKDKDERRIWGADLSFSEYCPEDKIICYDKNGLWDETAICIMEIPKAPAAKRPPPAEFKTLLFVSTDEWDEAFRYEWNETFRAKYHQKNALRQEWNKAVENLHALIKEQAKIYDDIKLDNVLRIRLLDKNRKELDDMFFSTESSFSVMFGSPISPILQSAYLSMLKSAYSIMLQKFETVRVFKKYVDFIELTVFREGIIARE